ncbi:unnamed protein product [Bursaphelenchus xylophilus]|uniref:(pine wood nematode) hypothetical protein n=1 Tax=Bursaphelenchus xylophilus TaxID=6326 RepID=A0A1I7SAI6_BURXY|nr:unnamed protein product [Bursaphelenchus xylophilus]CAG9079370.1 unnamed protein product [Bursaphelenchus xylophilus]
MLIEEPKKPFILMVDIPASSSHLSVELFPPRIDARKGRPRRATDNQSLRVAVLHRCQEEAWNRYMAEHPVVAEPCQKHSLMEVDENPEVEAKKFKIEDMKPLPIEEVMTPEELEELGLLIDDTIFDKF